MKKLKVKKLNQKGQTMVEYILLIAVIMVLMSSIFGQIHALLLDNPDSLTNTYLDSYRNMFEGGNASFKGRYKYYQIPR